MANINIKPKPGQTLADLALQYYGSIEAWVQIASDNGISLTEELDINKDIVLRDENIINRQVVSFYARKETIVATDNQ